MNHSPPGSSIHGISEARMLELVVFLLQGIFLTQGSNNQTCVFCPGRWTLLYIKRINPREENIIEISSCLFGERSSGDLSHIPTLTPHKKSQTFLSMKSDHGDFLFKVCSLPGIFQIDRHRLRYLSRLLVDSFSFLFLPLF